MNIMETSSSLSNPIPTNGSSQEELGLEDLWSELHAIKKLYGLLHQSNAKISDGDAYNCLDEKSRVVLKKLLDGATHQALQSQAKIVCYTPEPPPPPSEKVENRESKTPTYEEVSTPEKLQKPYSVAAEQDKKGTAESNVPSAKLLNPSQNPKIEPDHHLPVAEPKIHRKPRPNANRVDLIRQNSQALQSQSKIVCYAPEPPPSSENCESRGPKTSNDEEASTLDKLQKCHSVAACQDKAESTKSSIPSSEVQAKKEPEHVLAVAELKVHRNPCPNVNRYNLSRQNSQKSTESKRLPPHHHSCQPHIRHRDQYSSKSKTRNNNNNTTNTKTEITPHQTTSGDLLAIVPAEKRARVEPTGTLVPFTSTNQTRIVGCIDRELTHSKYSDTKVRPTQRIQYEAIGKIPSRMGSIRDRRTSSKIPNQTSSKIPSRMGIKDQRTTSKPPSQMRSIKDRRTSSSIASTDHQNRKENYRQDIIPRKPPRQLRDQIDPRPKKSIAYSSSSTSQTSRSDSSASISSSVKKAGPTYSRQRSPRRIPSRRKNVGPLPRAKAENKKSSLEAKEGRLKRFKNKLAVIFHHHHHHHHIHDGGQVAPIQKQQHRSTWTYLKSVVHHTSGARNGDKLARGPSEKKQHGYLHVLLEGLIQHVWGMRRKRRQKGAGGSGGKVKGKKRLHWWQRFRRRGGVKLANKKMPRLRLGFRRSHSKNGRDKKS